MQLTFSVIVPTYNRLDRLKECLRALARLDFPQDRYEVIVVDDGGSTSLAPAIDSVADHMEVRLHRQENAGPAAARNAGAAQSNGTFLAFTDDDCMPEARWLKVFSDRLEMSPDSLFGGRTVNALNENVFSSASQLLIDYLYEFYVEASRGRPFFTSNNIALSREQFLSVGGFRTSFRRAAGEDREFCDRWLELGLRMEYAPTAVVRHAHALTGRTFWLQHFQYGRAAYEFHRIRRHERERTHTIEPVMFYVDLVRYPLRSPSRRRPVLESLLLLVSQVANASGYFWEKLITSGR